MLRFWVDMNFGRTLFKALHTYWPMLPMHIKIHILQSHPLCHMYVDNTGRARKDFYNPIGQLRTF